MIMISSDERDEAVMLVAAVFEPMRGDEGVEVTRVWFETVVEVTERTDGGFLDTRTAGCRD